MRQVFIGALAAALAGCSFAPQQTWLRECTEANGFECSNGTTNTSQINSGHLLLRRGAIVAKKENGRYRTSARNKNGQGNIARKTSSLELDDKSNTVVNAKSIATQTKTPQSSTLNENFDPLIEKAKATIAAKMPNPASVEFAEMKRAARKTVLGNPVDTICGYVWAKNASGADIGARPFLYIVPKNEAYVGGYVIATSPYHNICAG